MRIIWVIIGLFIAGCSTPQKTYDYKAVIASELAIKQEPKFKKPSYIGKRNGRATPYSVQENRHDAVKTTLNILVDENPKYTFCVDEREARIGVLNVKLPRCSTQSRQENLGAKLVLIDTIDFLETPETIMYIQVQPVSVINHGAPHKMAYGCIKWSFRFDLIDADVWQSNSEFKHPLGDSECIEQPIEYIIVTEN